MLLTTINFLLWLLSSSTNNYIYIMALKKKILTFICYFETMLMQFKIKSCLASLNPDIKWSFLLWRRDKAIVYASIYRWWIYESISSIIGPFKVVERLKSILLYRDNTPSVQFQTTGLLPSLCRHLLWRKLLVLHSSWFYWKNQIHSMLFCSII